MKPTVTARPTLSRTEMSPVAMNQKAVTNPAYWMGRNRNVSQR